MTATTTGLTVASVAALGLPGTEHAYPGQPLAGEAWAHLRRETREHRLTGLLLAAVDKGQVPVTPEQREDLVTDQVRAMSLALVLEDLLLEVAELLAAHDLDVRVIKGPAVAHLDYPAPEMRSYGDIDVLLRSSQFNDAVRVLEGHGLARLYPAKSPVWDRRWAKGVTLRTSDGTELDVHRTLATPPVGLRVDLDDLWSRGEEFSVGGRTVTALAREHRLLSAAFSASVGDTEPSCATLRDVAQLVLDSRLDPALVRDTATRSGAGAVLAQAVATTWRVLRIADVTALSAWADRYRPTEVEHRELALYQHHRVTETARAMATLRMLPGVTERARFLWVVAGPSSGFRSTSTRGARERMVRAVSDLRSAGRGR